MKYKRKRTIYETLFKRPIDFFAALLLLIIIMPIFLFVALLVRIKHGKPIFFRQRRVGRNRKIFSVYKFRSMSNKCDQFGELLPDRERLTSFGKFIRKTSLDELPQLINIIKGEMSFIGPRPRPTEECVFLDEEQCKRFAVRPGISGLAQVSGRNAITLDKVTEYDNKYVAKVSAWRDIKILFRTVFVVLRRKGIDGNTEGQNATEYYGDRLLRIGTVSREEYDARIAVAKSLNAKDVMPTIVMQKAIKQHNRGARCLSRSQSQRRGVRNFSSSKKQKSETPCPSNSGQEVTALAASKMPAELFKTAAKRKVKKAS